VAPSYKPPNIAYPHRPQELVAGTKLFVPVFAKRTLFEVGDGHAAQGNGEVDITALETWTI
jgi:acetamidase/formamidase